MMIKLYVKLLYNTRLFCRGLLVNFLALNIYNFILSIIPRKMEDKELRRHRIPRKRIYLKLFYSATISAHGTQQKTHKLQQLR